MSKRKDNIEKKFRHFYKLKKNEHERSKDKNDVLKSKNQKKKNIIPHEDVQYY